MSDLCEKLCLQRLPFIIFLEIGMYLPIYLIEFVEQTIDEGQRLYFKEKILIIETERE